MKKRTVLRSVAALTLAVVMLLALALPALAAGDGSITITPNGQEGLGGADRFTAYQVFKGDVNNVDNQLVNLTWGSGVDNVALIAAMKISDMPLESSTFGAVFSAAWTKWHDEYSGEIDEAEFVAQWLGEHLTLTYADEFARLVAGHTNGDGTKSQLSGDNWVIENLDPGYYLVIDNYSNGTEAPDGSVSSYILQVVGNVTVPLKATIPTVEKNIVSGSALVDGILTETETPVTYRLTGTVAENIVEYKTYEYTFTDTISAGLTMSADDLYNLTVTYQNGSATETFTKNKDYTATLEPGVGTQEGKPHTLTVTFGNLKKSLTDTVSGIDLTNKETVDNIKIVVTYTAHLNQYAVIGRDGNPNTVILEYSNDPYSTDTGKSVPDTVNTYTLALQILKKGADGEPLPDVGFKLIKGSSTTPTTGENDFATFNNGEEGSEKYKEIKDWVHGMINVVGDTLTTDSSGVINIHGLSAGTYTLVETETPEGYETMKPIELSPVLEVHRQNPDRNTLKRRSGGNHISSVSTSVISLAVAVTMRIPLSLIPSSKASS